MKHWVVGLTIVLALAVALGVSGCGRKARPSLPKREMPFRIEELSATWEDGRALLEGRLVKPSDKKAEISETEITGWRVYHAHYPVENAPCEGCPLDFSRVHEVEGKLGEDGRYSAHVALDPPVGGIHFFQVRLIGRGWAPGNLSNQAKLVIHQ